MQHHFPECSPDLGDGPGAAPTGEMPNHERMRMRAAAMRAAASYPGPVGELLVQELEAWEEFGHRLGGHALMTRLVTYLLGDR
ncbi:hypothetical protein [Pseudonocardia spirodelae]|uniref:Uncharacterized protein n=1 Tax=Pseudonocardia spirodelae TaxID=3133431 RepID=A0ABU8T3K4_9PSEU